MMNPIRVNATGMNAQAVELERLQAELERVSETVGSVSSSLTWNIPGSAGIRDVLLLQKRQLSAHGSKTGAMASGLRKVSELYETTESAIVKGEYSAAGQSSGGAGKGDGGGGGGSWGGPVGAVIGGAVAIFSSAEVTVKEKDKYLEWKNKKAFNKAAGTPKQKEISKKQINKDEKWYKKSGTIVEAKGEAKAEASLKEYSGEKKGKYAQGSGDLKVVTAEANASAEGGLYVYEKDSSGKTKRIFSPGVSAEVGASVALLNATAEGRAGLGDDNKLLGVYGKADAEFASAEAKAKIGINRKEVHAEAKAEANLVKVEGAMGVTVLGTDIGVTAGVKVGVGAHAEVGYTDGKIKVDIGAAVGVGVDLGFEIDVSGTVDAVCGFAKSIFSF